MNLARYGVKLELRFVIHKLNSERLAAFARFVARNLPFVGHVALMGLELVGYARSNLEALWIDLERNRASGKRVATALHLCRGCFLQFGHYEITALKTMLWLPAFITKNT